MVTFPNGMSVSRRRAMLGDEYEVFRARVEEVTRAIDKALKPAPGSNPLINMVQRHYKSQRSEPVYDATLRFDPRTTVGGDKTVGLQPQWLKAVFEALEARRSNLQIQIGAEFLYARCEAVRSKSIADVIADVWVSCAPILEASQTAGR